MSCIRPRESGGGAFPPHPEVPARSAGLEGCCSGAIEIGKPISRMLSAKSAIADLDGRRPSRLASLPKVVIAGLDPAIHADCHVSMDHRIKSGGDEAGEGPFPLILRWPRSGPRRMLLRCKRNRLADFENVKCKSAIADLGGRRPSRLAEPVVGPRASRGPVGSHLRMTDHCIVIATTRGEWPFPSS